MVEGICMSCYQLCEWCCEFTLSMSKLFPLQQSYLFIITLFFSHGKADLFIQNLSNFESNHNKGFKKQHVVKDRLRELIKIQTCVVSLRGFLCGLEFLVLKEEFFGGGWWRKSQSISPLLRTHNWHWPGPSNE